MYKGFSFSTSLPTLVIICLIINCHSGCKVIPYCGFDLHFLDANDVNHHFMCLLAVCLSSLDCLFGSFAYFKIGLLLYY